MRPSLCLAMLLVLSACTVRAAEAPERKELAIGTASLGLTYLPVIIAERTHVGAVPPSAPRHLAGAETGSHQESRPRPGD